MNPSSNLDGIAAKALHLEKQQLLQIIDVLEKGENANS